MSRTLLVLVDDHLINVGDISTVAPARWDQTVPNTDRPQEGVRVTFMSKGTSVYIPGYTPETFIDKLIASTAKLDLPD